MAKEGKNKVCSIGVVNISAGFNNTIVSVADESGNVLSWSSSGKMKFKGAQKSTPYAASQAAEVAAKNAMEHGLKSVDVYVKGPGAGRDSTIRTFNKNGFNITKISDVTPVPHNGCRPPKKRRV